MNNMSGGKHILALSKMLSLVYSFFFCKFRLTWCLVDYIWDMLDFENHPAIRSGMYLNDNDDNVILSKTKVCTGTGERTRLDTNMS